MRELAPALDMLVSLLASPRRRFYSLSKDKVSQSAGLYIIYQEQPLEVVKSASASGRGNLCWRSFLSTTFGPRRISKKPS